LAPGFPSEPTHELYLTAWEGIFYILIDTGETLYKNNYLPIRNCLLVKSLWLHT
jgi:hypothetical protein